MEMDMREIDRRDRIEREQKWSEGRCVCVCVIGKEERERDVR
jgi:hypothetical protein